MVAGWHDLEAELGCWGDAGLAATLWWRDDDAASAGARLGRLFAIADGIPLALAVIPAAAQCDLAERIAGMASVAVLQHGWRHVNHGGEGKKSEFPPGRTPDAVASDLAAGRARLAALFAGQALAVLAPPWNRFDAAFLPLLAAAGIGAISCIKPRAARWPAPHVFAVNVHADLVDWRGGRGFVGEGAALGALLAHLRDRRLGRCDADEPTGILTHHLVQDEAADAFLTRLVALIRAHPAAHWLDPRVVFAAADGGRA